MPFAKIGLRKLLAAFAHPVNNFAGYYASRQASQLALFGFFAVSSG
jgi:hypothetical protein